MDGRESEADSGGPFSRVDAHQQRSTVERFVERHPWIDQVAKTGWLSRGIVYLVFGLLAVPIAFQESAPQDEASPSGALGRIVDIPTGRLLLAVLVVGMVLYIAFQLLSLALIVETTIGAWWRRAGNLMAALLYSTFAWSAAKLAVSGQKSTDGSLIERVSKAVLDASGGRWLVGIAGLVTIGAGGYFFYRHVILRGFVEGLTSLGDEPTDNSISGGTLVVMGVIGWTGRSMVVALIGFFLVQSAWTYDPNDARGFDRALREAASSGLGSVLVLTAAIGLAAYGSFCVASHRHRTVRDNESDQRSDSVAG